MLKIAANGTQPESGEWLSVGNPESGDRVCVVSAH
jgi:hypothetical protein